MGKLSAQQRAILSLKYFEDMNLGQASYILDIGYFRVLWLFLNAHIRLKLLLIMSGHPVITLKRLIAAFDKFTRN